MGTVAISAFSAFWLTFEPRSSILVEALGWLGSWPQFCGPLTFETSFGKHTFVLIRLQELALEYLYEVELCRCFPWHFWNLPLQRTLQALQMASAQTTASALEVLVLSGCPASSHRCLPISVLIKKPCTELRTEVYKGKLRGVTEVDSCLKSLFLWLELTTRQVAIKVLADMGGPPAPFCLLGCACG